MSRVRAGSPFPTVPEELVHAITPRLHGMQFSGVEQISIERCFARDMLPLRFCWQAATSPTGKGIRFEIIYMAPPHTTERGKALPAPQGETAPASPIMSIPFPVERPQPR